MEDADPPSAGEITAGADLHRGALLEAAATLAGDRLLAGEAEAQTAGGAAEAQTAGEDLPVPRCASEDGARLEVRAEEGAGAPTEPREEDEARRREVAVAAPAGDDQSLASILVGWVLALLFCWCDERVRSRGR